MCDLFRHVWSFSGPIASYYRPVWGISPLLSLFTPCVHQAPLPLPGVRFKGRIVCFGCLHSRGALRPTYRNTRIADGGGLRQGSLGAWGTLKLSLFYFLGGCFSSPQRIIVDFLSLVSGLGHPTGKMESLR